MASFTLIFEAAVLALAIITPVSPTLLHSDTISAIFP